MSTCGPPPQPPAGNASGRKVFCQKFQKELPGLDSPPWPGELGQRIYENISADAWKAIYLDVMKDAPWVPIFNEQRFTYHSERLGGDASLFTDPIHIPVNYDYIFAKDAQ